MTRNVLNLYAGIGGNRKRWDDVDVTAVEWNEQRARCYQDHFPDDDVIVADAHEFLIDHFENYDFIWASPPCPTHSKMRHHINQNVDDVYPDMKLYQERIFLEHNFSGDYVIENVDPYYDAMFEPVKRGRHMFWSNFHIPEIEMDGQNIENTGAPKDKVAFLESKYGFDTSGYDLTLQKRRKMLLNCVNPELGEHVFDAATTNRQQTLGAIE